MRVSSSLSSIRYVAFVCEPPVIPSRPRSRTRDRARLSRSTAQGWGPCSWNCASSHTNNIAEGPGWSRRYGVVVVRQLFRNAMCGSSSRRGARVAADGAMAGVRGRRGCGRPGASTCRAGSACRIQSCPAERGHHDPLAVARGPSWPPWLPWLPWPGSQAGPARFVCGAASRRRQAGRQAEASSAWAGLLALHGRVGAPRPANRSQHALAPQVRRSRRALSWVSSSQLANSWRLSTPSGRRRRERARCRPSMGTKPSSGGRVAST